MQDNPLFPDLLSSSSCRREFRDVLRAVVSCLRDQLDVPGVSPFNAEELVDWFQSLQVEDIQAVWNCESSDSKA